jgi:TetR/AcrR family transcriptional repressor of nem operon
MSGPHNRERILDIAQELMTTSGFNAFSYRDISAVLGLRNASIHYHFPTKEDLGVATITRHHRELRESNELLLSAPLDPREKLERAFQVARGITGRARHICLLGIVQAEYESYPESMQACVRELGRYHRRVVCQILDEGLAKGCFRFEGEVEEQATLIITAVQGSLQLARALSAPDILERTLRALWRALGASPPEVRQAEAAVELLREV